MKEKLYFITNDEIFFEKMINLKHKMIEVYFSGISAGLCSESNYQDHISISCIFFKLNKLQINVPFCSISIVNCISKFFENSDFLKIDISKMIETLEESEIKFLIDLEKFHKNKSSSEELKKFYS